VQWVPGRQGAEGNEHADQAAKRAAARPTRGQGGTLYLAYISRTVTEARVEARQSWLSRVLSKRLAKAQRAYRPGKGWKQDLVIAKAPKKVASRYSQLKVGHAAVGEYLQRIGAQDDAACQWCSAPKETVHHLLCECWWREQRMVLCRALAKARIQPPARAEDCPEGRLFGDPKAAKPLLGFLATTAVGCRRGEAERAAGEALRDGKWGLEELEEGDQAGVG
jgi:hypothetical protein